MRFDTGSSCHHSDSTLCHADLRQGGYHKRLSDSDRVQSSSHTAPPTQSTETVTMRQSRLSTVRRVDYWGALNQCTYHNSVLMIKHLPVAVLPFARATRWQNPHCCMCDSSKFEKVEGLPPFHNSPRREGRVAA